MRYSNQSFKITGWTLIAWNIIGWITTKFDDIVHEHATKPVTIDCTITGYFKEYMYMLQVYCYCNGCPAVLYRQSDQHCAHTCAVPANNQNRYRDAGNEGISPQTLSCVP